MKKFGKAIKSFLKFLFCGLIIWIVLMGLNVKIEYKVEYAKKRNSSLWKGFTKIVRIIKTAKPLF